jgi:hypothetical protein
MTRGPRATLGVPIPVDLPRPRSTESLQHDPAALRVRAHIIEALTGALPSRSTDARTSEVRAVDANMQLVEAGGKP